MHSTMILSLLEEHWSTSGENTLAKEPMLIDIANVLLQTNMNNILPSGKD